MLTASRQATLSPIADRVAGIKAKIESSSSTSRFVEKVEEIGKRNHVCGDFHYWQANGDKGVGTDRPWGWGA